jgi:hypothetical protein
MAAAAFMVVASDMKENERAFIFALSKTLLLNSNFGRQDTCDNEDF